MNSAIASILLSKIEDLVWLDNKFGLTRPAVIAVSNPLDGTKTLKKTFPVACNLSEDECSAGAYMDCVPNSKFMSLLYFEDNGVQILGADDRWIQFRSNLKLVCWLNGKKLGHDGCSLSTKALSDILSSFAQVKKGFNSSPYSAIVINVVSEDPKSAAIFSKYSYDESVSQYTMFPNDYFALNIQTTFNLPIDCIPEFEILPEQC